MYYKWQWETISESIIFLEQRPNINRGEGMAFVRHRVDGNGTLINEREGGLV